MNRYDVVVIGSGPAGQKAAVGAAKAGRRVAVVEQSRNIGGACVHYGTIPSKSLRERAVERRKLTDWLDQCGMPSATPVTDVASLIGEMGEVVAAHDTYMAQQLTRNGVTVLRGRASFLDAYRLRVVHTDGSAEILGAKHFVIATGSKPRTPPNVPIDHETIFDSDSILSLAYLPASLVVLGGGVIASEYASVFAVLGVKVTMIDRFPTPLGFLEPELVQGFLNGFARYGGSFIGEADVESVSFDGVSQVVTRLVGGREIRSEKLLCALGRRSLLDGLDAHKAGIEVDAKELIPVNDDLQTVMRHIYAAGDVIGPPSLASASMEQGRRVACHLTGKDPGAQGEWLPSGIYAVPELACVGLTEAKTKERYGGAIVGIARFDEVARGHISASQEGLLKMIVSPDRVVRGVHVVGENATEMVHIAQMGLIQNATVDTYVENVFNFPTFAESYRVAALAAAAKLEVSDAPTRRDVA
ncbi:MAG: Si-specific NAD(P)(+) transhydrogenase [Gammaproteobacteria bacterium]|nr:Si-specific NAD(P)(+) transhydrogenase [Gammaproteobacteria bacterium]